MTQNIERAVHLVGTYPIPNGGDAAAMQEMLEIAGASPTIAAKWRDRSAWLDHK